MSFDKMNTFVEEHTILMREFLRNISTMTEYETGYYNNRNNYSLNGYYNNSNVEVNLELDLIDICKQSCILHVLLSSITAGLDEVS